MLNCERIVRPSTGVASAKMFDTSLYFLYSRRFFSSHSRGFWPSPFHVPSSIEAIDPSGRYGFQYGSMKRAAEMGVTSVYEPSSACSMPW